MHRLRAEFGITVPGIGLLTATAMVARIGDAKSVQNGRHLAAWLGLVLRQRSNGVKSKLLGISRRGDVYLRTLLIQGARAAIWFLGQQECVDCLGITYPGQTLSI